MQNQRKSVQSYNDENESNHENYQYKSIYGKNEHQGPMRQSHSLENSNINFTHSEIDQNGKHES